MSSKWLVEKVKLSTFIFTNRKMSSSWDDHFIIYYTSKALGLFPLINNRFFFGHIYTILMWIILFYYTYDFNVNIYYDIFDVRHKHQIVLKIIYTQIWVQNITAIMTIIRSAFQTSIFFDLLGKFDAFDKIYLKVHLAPNKRIQVFYVCYIVFFGTCHLVYLIKVLPISMVIIVRVIVCCLTILSVVHYAVFVRTLRKRYEIANTFFKKYLFNANINAEEIHPVGAEQLFKELRNLTNHVKSYGAINALMFIVESTTIFVSCMSIITIHNIKKNIYMYLFYSIHSIGRLIFFIIFTREIHNTIEESKLTVRIAHEAHSKSINPVKSKQFDAFIFNYWNNRITFDVYDLFDIDYKLVQSILTAVAAYAAIFIQIQLTLENKERYSNNSTEKELINR